jgi:hypothetical protein
MKYLITESKLNKTIESFIRKNYPEVVSVSFDKKPTWLAGEDRGHDVTIIYVIVDPHKILEGNINGAFKQYDNDIRRDIWKTLNSFFNLEFDKYGSDWDIEVYGIKLNRI